MGLTTYIHILYEILLYTRMSTVTNMMGWNLKVNHANLTNTEPVLIQITHINTGLFKMIVGVLTTGDRSRCIFLFNRTTLQVFV